MCGICGLVWRSSVPNHTVRGQAVLEAIMEKMRHRGPDGKGILVGARFSLGHLRLSIMDIDGGGQPMSDPDGLVSLSYNGEVYDLEDRIVFQSAQGWKFRTKSDTETLLAGYLLNGSKFDFDLNGMYAYAMLDRRPDVSALQIGVDPVGIKPLYFVETEEAVLFASELSGLLAGMSALSVPVIIDEAAVSLYLSLGWVPAPLTLISGVRKMTPGERMRISLKDGSITALEKRLLPSPKPGFIASKLGETLDAAVARQLVSDAPVGFFLSGGIDSSLLVCTAHRLGIRPKTFNVSFVGPGHGVAEANEASVAREVATLCGAEHHELEVSAATLALGLGDALIAMDQPIADPACLPLLLLARFAREHVKVCLSGDGGDELFLGYPRHRFANYKAIWRNTPRPLQAGISVLASCLPASPGSGILESLRKVGVGVDLLTSPDYFTGPFSGRYAANLSQGIELPAWALNVPADSEALFEADMLGQLAGQMLPKTDHVTMFASIETRVPFLDLDMIAAARAIPMGEKLSGGYGKAPLRRLLAQYLPSDITDRPKKGFRVPLTSWFRGELVPLMRAQLLDVPNAAAGLIDRFKLERLLEDHIAGRAEHSSRIWALLALQAWIDSLPQRRA